jgi:hypothetical protein
MNECEGFEVLRLLSGALCRSLQHAPLDIAFHKLVLCCSVAQSAGVPHCDSTGCCMHGRWWSQRYVDLLSQ